MKDPTKITAIPLELATANEFVANLHRHHDPVYRDKFRIGALVDGKLVGVVQVGRPVSRHLLSTHESFTKQDLYTPKKMCGAHTTTGMLAVWNKVRKQKGAEKDE